MLLGYLHPEDKTERLRRRRYFRTGDLGRWVDGDYLVVTGRAKDIIIRNGENISPKEIEDLLIAEPGIAEIAIVGLPDPGPANGPALSSLPEGPRGPTSRTCARAAQLETVWRSSRFRSGWRSGMRFRRTTRARYSNTRSGRR